MASSLDREVIFALEEGVARITFNRPAALNSVNIAMSRQLAGIADQIPHWGARVIVLRGAGGHFMAGGDVAEMGAAGDTVAVVDELIANAHKFSLALMRADAPIVAVMEGAVAGYGLSLALSCDFSICADDARLSFAYRRLGATCDGGPSFILPRIVGHQRAMALLLTADRIDPQAAAQMGLLTRIVPAPEVESAAGALTGDLMANSPPAAAAVKRLIRGWEIEQFAEALEAERQAFKRAAAGPDFREGLRGFMEKRRPVFGAAGDDA